MAMSPPHPSSRNKTLGSPTARARRVAVPEDLGDDGDKATGCVELPLHLAWSEPRRAYDLANRYDRRRVYEQVLSEGDVDEVRYFVRASELLGLWDELVLPRHVRVAWESWVLARRSA
jgi:hypothetical protein